MLKGQVFKEQIFESQVFAVFINTFLAGKNGIINGYKNSMQPTAGSNSVTISSGVICIQGRFLEEDTETTLNTGTDTAFCKLVIEVDLDKVNTETDFTQGYYKIVKGASDYPILTQDDIINTNSGVYQYELARFKTTLNGITDFIDMRSYLDFNSIYAEIESKINEIEDESIYALKSDLKSFETRLQNTENKVDTKLNEIDTEIEKYSKANLLYLENSRSSSKTINLDEKWNNFKELVFVYETYAGYRGSMSLLMENISTGTNYCSHSIPTGSAQRYINVVFQNEKSIIASSSYADECYLLQIYGVGRK